MCTLANNLEMPNPMMLEQAVQRRNEPAKLTNHKNFKGDPRHHMQPRETGTLTKPSSITAIGRNRNATQVDASNATTESD